MIRANFLPASLLPFAAGLMLAVRDAGQEISAGRILAGFLAVAFGHAGANALNNYYDHKSGADSELVSTTPFYGGSDLIKTGQVPPGKVLRWGIALMAASLSALVALSALTGDPVFLLAGALFLVLAAQYTAPPLKLAYRGLGEITVFLLFGLLLVPAGFYVLSNTVTFSAILLSLPMAFLIFAVIFVNEVPDRPTDIASGKFNLTSRVKEELFSVVYLAALIAATLSLIGCVLTGILPQITLWGAFITIAAGLFCANRIREHIVSARDLKNCCGITAGLHSAVTAIIITGLAL